MLVIINICQMRVSHKTMHLFRGKPFMKKMITGYFSADVSLTLLTPPRVHRGLQGGFEKMLLLRLGVP